MARINRQLTKDNQQLFISRSKDDIARYAYFIADKTTGAIVQGLKADKDLINYARENGFMKPAEQLKGD